MNSILSKALIVAIALQAKFVGFTRAAADPAQDRQITVAAAISLKESLETIAKQYEARTGEAVRFTFGGSGQLAAQVEQGAPVDVFISAANQQADDLMKAKLADPATRRTVARNRLVLIVPGGAKDADTPHSFSDLADAKFARIAVGQPKSVPAGQYARQALERLRVFDAVKDRLIYAGNVRQVLDYVERGEVSAGIVYRTDAIQSGDKVRVVATAESALHDVIEYPAVVITASKRADAAQKFVEYLTGEEAQAVLRARGFDEPGSSRAPPPPSSSAPTSR